jgi:hypothetical protein
MTKTPAQEVQQAFWQLPEDARKSIGASLVAAENHKVLHELGRALLSNGSVLSLLLIENGLMATRWDPESLPLADRLAEGTAPWPVLGTAIRQTVANRDGPPDDLILYADETADGV